MTREMRIDIVRGIAMLTILLNHFAMTFRAVGFSGWQIQTPTQLGYSSAASIFVALSGYMVGMVYLRRDRPYLAVMKRAFDLYVLNFAIFLLVAPVALFADPAKDHFWYMQSLLDDPFAATLRFMTLRDAPAFLDVLQLYVALLLMTPVAILLMRRSRWLLVAASVGLWALIQFWPFVMPHGWRVPMIGRTLNALAWQLCFFLPMIAGQARVHVPVFAFFRRHWWTVPLIVGALVAAGYAHDIDLRLTEPRLHMALTSRPVHGPVWTAHALLLLAGYCGALALLGGWLRFWPFRMLACIGRNSLNVYAASIPLIFGTALLIGTLRLDAVGYGVGVGLVVLASLAVAAWSDGRRRIRKARMSPEPAFQPA